MKSRLMKYPHTTPRRIWIRQSRVNEDPNRDEQDDVAHEVYVNTSSDTYFPKNSGLPATTVIENPVLLDKNTTMAPIENDTAFTRGWCRDVRRMIRGVDAEAIDGSPYRLLYST